MAGNGDLEMAARDLPGHFARGTSRRRPPGDAKDEAPWKKKPEREFDRKQGNIDKGDRQTTKNQRPDRHRAPAKTSCR